MKKLVSFLKVVGRIEGLAIAGVLLLLYIAFMITSPEVFLKYRIYMSFLQTVAPPLILALGLTFVITAGEIDLSFPSIVAFSGFVFVWTFKELDDSFLGATWAAWVSLALALAAGAFVGFTNGILVAKIGVPSIMATLAAQFFWSGVTVLLSTGLSWTIPGFYDYVPGQEGPADNLVHKIFVGRIYGVIPKQGRGFIGIPPQALWALGLTIVLWFILNRHKFGEAIMFIGDNANVARVMGINVEATKIKLFTLMGLISAFAGVILTFQMRVFFPTQGSGMLLPVMAAVFIGGTSIAGGKGFLVGTFFGSYIIGSLEAGVVASGISGFWVQLVEGLVMAAVVILNIVVGEGNLGAIRERVRRWSVPTRRESTDERIRVSELPPKDDVAVT